MAPKKDKVPKIDHVKRKPRRSSSFPKRTLKKDRQRILTLISEMRKVRAEASSEKDCQDRILKKLDDHGSALARISEVIKAAIQQNTLTEQLLDLMLVMILIGS